MTAQNDAQKPMTEISLAFYKLEFNSAQKVICIYTNLIGFDFVFQKLSAHTKYRFLVSKQMWQ